MKKFRWQRKKEIAQESQNQDESLQKQLDQMEAQRNAFQEEVQRLSAELKEVEGHRALFLAQRDVLQQEVMRLYQGHTNLENEINFLKYRIETLDALHERVVQSHWAKETDPATKYTCAYPFVMQRNNFREAEALVGLAKRWHADFIRFLALANWGTFSAEEYCRENVFDPKNEEYAEASALLRRICTQTKDLKIYQNIIANCNNKLDTPW